MGVVPVTYMLYEPRKIIFFQFNLICKMGIITIALSQSCYET